MRESGQKPAYGPGVCSGIICSKPKTCGRPRDWFGRHLRKGKGRKTR